MMTIDLSKPLKDHPPFALREANGQNPEWYCIVAGKVQGPWPDKGSCAAGYEVEKRRAYA